MARPRLRCALGPHAHPWPARGRASAAEGGGGMSVARSQRGSHVACSVTAPGSARRPRLIRHILLSVDRRGPVGRRTGRRITDFRPSGTQGRADPRESSRPARGRAGAADRSLATWRPPGLPKGWRATPVDRAAGREGAEGAEAGSPRGPVRVDPSDGRVWVAPFRSEPGGWPVREG